MSRETTTTVKITCDHCGKVYADDGRFPIFGGRIDVSPECEGELTVADARKLLEAKTPSRPALLPAPPP